MWFICVKMKYEGWNFVAYLFPNLKWITGLLGGSLLGVLVMSLRSSENASD
jgi:hypothetical protein